MGGFHDAPKGVAAAAAPLGSEASELGRRAPGPGRVWLVLGDKRGDNAQIDILVESLGWRCERKELAMRPAYERAKPRYRASLGHIDLTRSDPLEPPWPDLVLTVGRRPSMAALWIREQSAGHTRIVLVGKPSGLLHRFDLVILSAEVQIPAYRNVLKIGLPLMRVRRDAVEAEAEAWHPRLASLPRPLVAVLVGGPTHPFVYKRGVVERLVRLARETVADGGTPYFTTSRRTPQALVDELRAALPSEAQVFAWTPDASDNPYAALLGSADAVVVTGDSLSMIVEVVRLGKPLAIFPLPFGWWGAIDQRRRSLARWLFAPPAATSGARLRAGLGRAAHRAGLLSHTRDFRAVHDFLIERGLATAVGDGFPAPGAPIPDDLPAAVERIRVLLTSS
jgi:mitochondrial fission protein ELM1